MHRIIAKQYIPNPHNKETVNHKNGIKTDNRISNLEWNTFEENYHHAIKNNLLSLMQSGQLNRTYKGDIGAYKGGQLVKILKGKTAIKQAGFSDSMVYNCVNGKCRQHKGHTFKRII